MGSYDSRAAVLYDSNNRPMDIVGGSLPATQSGILIFGSAGSQARSILVDGFGRQIVVGATLDGASVIDNPFLVAAKDGSDIAHIIRSDDQGRIELAPASIPTYAASTNGTVSTGTLLATNTSIAYLFHPLASTKRVEIMSIRVSWASGNVGRFTIRGNFITAEGSGGTSQTINSLDRGDAASAMTFRSGGSAPTRVAGDLFCISADTSSNNVQVITPQIIGKQIVLRAGVAEGFEIRTVIEAIATTAAQIAVDYIWKES